MKPQYLLLYIFLMLYASASAQAPLEFIENKGQWGDWLKYKASTPSGDVCLENDGLRYILCDPENNYQLDFFHHGQTRVKPILKFHAYKVIFVDAAIPKMSGENPQQVYYNYFLGSDSSRWKAGIHPYHDVNYSNVYRGIDMHFSSDKGNIVYEFIVRPESDAAQVKLKFDGQDNLQIRNNELIVSTSVGQVSKMKPYAYQFINEVRVEVPCKYRLTKNVLTYEFPEGYDHSKMLVIDPVVVLCTMTGSSADNWGYTATYDDAGNFYAGGLVNCLAYGGHFPVSPGAFQITYGGGYGTLSTADSTYACDISIIKYDPTLANRIYATYIGGTGNERPHSLIVDPAGDLIIAGRTRSVDYPVTVGCVQGSNHGGWDMVVSKLNPAGTSLIGSTYLGGAGNDGVNFDSTEYGFGELKYNYGDDARGEVQIDRAGNIYVADCSNSTDFPTTATAISNTLSGMQDGVVFKMNSTLTSLLWSTYLGGNGSDAAYALAFDTSGTSLYVAGGTNSTNFPTTAGALHTASLGGIDGFVLKFNCNPPYNLQKGTYIGTSNYDQVFGIQVSETTNEVYVTGQSLGGLFPVTGGVYSNPNSCQFVMKMDSMLSTDLISTVFGNGDATVTNISPVAFFVDTSDNVYISGWSGNLGIGVASSGLCFGMAVTSDAFKPTTVDGQDFYFMVLGPGMTSLRYASFYGRNCDSASQKWEGEHVDGGTSRFSKQGTIYQAICASCGGKPSSWPGVSCSDPFPTTSGVWSETDSSTNCNEAALKVAFNIGTGILQVSNVNASTIIKTYPNPATSFVNIAGVFEGDNITLYNLVGQPLRGVTAAGNIVATLPVNDLPQGYYLIEITDASGAVKSRTPIQKR